MKRLIITLVTTVLAASVLASDAAKPRRTRPKGLSRPSGGIVEKTHEGDVLRVVNAQNVVPDATIAKTTQQIRWTSLLPVECERFNGKADSPIALAASIPQHEKIGAGVLLTEDPNLPIILSSPDGKWAILNVASLKADAADLPKTESRFTRLYWNAIARCLGVGNSGYKGCVLMPFTSIEDIDRMGVLQPCPEPFNKMIDAASAYGIKTITIASYRTACEQGWAPPPANDVQKAIKAEVNAEKERGPTNALQIKP